MIKLEILYITIIFYRSIYKRQISSEGMAHYFQLLEGFQQSRSSIAMAKIHEINLEKSSCLSKDLFVYHHFYKN